MRGANISPVTTVARRGRASGAGGPGKRARPRVLEAPHEADAVLRDREALVGARRAAAAGPRSR